MNPSRLVQPQTALETQNIPLHFQQTGYSETNITFWSCMRRHPPWRSGCGLPCGVRQRPGGRWPVQPRGGALRGEPEHPAAHGGQVHGEGVVPAIDAAVRGMEGFGLRLVRTAPAGGLGVQQLFGPGGEAQVERELLWAVFWVFMTQRMVWPAPLRSQAYTPSSRLSLATHSKQRGSYSPA